MSAYNWTKCPRCADKGPKAKSNALEYAESRYGKIPAEDYVGLLTAAKAMPDDVAEDTLREYYGIGVYEGQFEIDYKCSCTRCGFTFRHSFKQKL